MKRGSYYVYTTSMLKGLMIFFIISLFSDAYACKCSFDPSKLLRHPEIAPVAIVGKVVDSKGYYSLVLVKSWSEGIEKIRLSAGKTCDPSGLKIGANYIFLAKGTSRETPYSNSCTSILKELSESKEIIKKLAKRDFIGKINPSWQFCESDSDCVQSKSQCGNQVGVNKKYKKDYLNFLKSKKEKVDCSKVEELKSSVSECVENFCS